ncbi:MAG: lamin tail domain-containing protein [Myxococcales bacterium]|nr:lamin tail domain-containing protein [Myxococcales bacterium]
MGRTQVAATGLVLAGCLWSAACGFDAGARREAEQIRDAGSSDAGSGDAGVQPAPPTLRLNEVVAKNQGVWVDELGETDDYVELFNASQQPLALGDYHIADASQQVALPDLELAPGEHVLLWADGTPAQGPLHLPFKLSGAGDSVTLSRSGRVVDSLSYSQLRENEALVRLPDGVGEPVLCRYASPGRENGDRCEPPAPPELEDDVHFAPYGWPRDWAAPAGPLRLSELALRPAAFVELYNASDAEVSLKGVSLRVASHGPGQPWPPVSDGHALPLPTTLAPHAYHRVEVTSAEVAELEADPFFEGVVTLFDADSGVLDRVDFMRWPEGAVLARGIQGGAGRFCENQSPGAENAICQQLPVREVGDRLRHLRTPADFAALAEGGSAVGVRSVKFVLDMQAGDVVHLLSAARYPLHYTFVREVIDGDPALDRCDAAQADAFYQGWVAFSQREYFVTEGRRYLLGTLSHHVGADLHAMEFTSGDVIPAEQMAYAFFAVAPHLLEPTRYWLRAQSGKQVDLMRAIEGQLPIVGPNEPFQNLTLQPLTPGVGYGVLRFIPADELSQAALGRDVIVVTDDVPNDIPLVGGLITEAFQTPLAHVNVLSQARDTPNMALREARDHPDVLAHLDRFVRLEVGGGGFSLRAAEAVEAEAFWQARGAAGPRVAPRLDTSLRDVIPLADRGLDELPAIGAKAAQLAELARVAAMSSCAGGFETPRDAAAIAIVHSLEHYQASGARARLAELQADASFRADPEVRAAGLAEVRELVLAHPVDSQLLASVTEYVATHFGEARVRFRSSSNTEDLPAFSGAGLYTSTSAAFDDPERPIADAMRVVWASLFSARAYDEREYANIDQQQVGMAILLHEAFLSERANGVAVSRNLLDPTRGDAYYMNLQIGEASVTNPAPGVTTEQLLYNHSGRLPLLRHQSHSSLTPDPVMSEAELAELACALGEVHRYYRPLLDPAQENPWFAMEMEFKRLGGERRLLIKQARPHGFGSAEMPSDCRELER